MKTKHLVIALVACLFALAMSSCTRITDAEITALEKSIEKLEKNYKDLTPSQLEKAVTLCQDQMDRLEEKELTSNQRKRLNKLDRRLFVLKLKIGWDDLINGVRESVSMNWVFQKP